MLRKGSPEWHADHGAPLLPCPKCNSVNLTGSDSDDSCCSIVCRDCGLSHWDFCGEVAGRGWNSGTIKPKHFNHDVVLQFNRVS